LNQSINSLSTRMDDFVVVGEETVLAHLVWGKPSETRMQNVALVGSEYNAAKTTEETFFEKVVRRTLSDYSKIYMGRHGPIPLVVRHASYGYDTPADNWLALNPMVGHALGWTLVADGYFHWVDHEGRTMAQSVWWIDGLLAHRPPKFDDEVGEGWLVLTSPEAFRLISTEFGSLERHALIQRTHSTEKGEVTKRLVQTVPL
jgi:hypothetical protein